MEEIIHQLQVRDERNGIPARKEKDHLTQVE
jgi:hypothetical protein